MAKKPNSPPLFTRDIVVTACREAIVRMNPVRLASNPVMFTVGVSAGLATGLSLMNLLKGDHILFEAQITFWLWVTVFFGNVAECLAEGRGKAQADSMRKTKTETMAKRIDDRDSLTPQLIPAVQLRRGDLVLVEPNDVIPSDGDIVKGIALVDESSITGESAPVVRESGGDRSAVTGGTRVVSDRVVVEVRVNPGESFLDRMIGMVEGASRQKTPSEIALTILLIGLTLIFLLVCVTLEGMAVFSGTVIPPIFMVALFITLIPTTIGGLLSAIGIAGMDRLVAFNVMAKSGRAVEASGDIDALLLDKTGTITYGNRMASEFIPVGGFHSDDVAEAAMLSSLADDTPEGKSIVRLAEEKYGVKADQRETEGMVFVPFTAQTRMSGMDRGDLSLRKGAPDTMMMLCGSSGDRDLIRAVEQVAKTGGTPLVLARNKKVMGVIHLKDIIKPAIHERFATLRRMGIRTVMITGDNPITAAAIAAEAGVDDFLAEASPEKKLELIRREQGRGCLVAMCGDGSNDAPALAQADVGVAMNTGTMAAREAGNMIDLDSDPTKLIEIVMIGKQLLMSRGALTTFSIANDVAKYFAIIPALLIGLYPEMAHLNIMHLGSAKSAILSAIIFNALIILALVPLALRGVSYTPAPAAVLLRRNLVLYGGGGMIVPFVAIKLIDMFVCFMAGGAL